MLYGIYRSWEGNGEWVAAQPVHSLRPSGTSLFEIFMTTNLGHALAQLSVWKRNEWLLLDGDTLHVAVIGKNGKPSRFVGIEEKEET